MKFGIVVIAVACIALSGIPSTVFADYQNIVLRPGETNTVNLYLNQGDQIQYSISVSGGSGNDADLNIQDSVGSSLLQIRVSNSYNSGFTAMSSGNYLFSFGNTFSIISSKQVGFSYNIIKPSQSFSSGGVSSIITILVIVGLIAAGIGAMRYAMKRGKKTASSYEYEDPKSKAKKEQNQRALDILKERLAHGEITREEFDKLRKEFE